MASTELSVQFYTHVHDRHLDSLKQLFERNEYSIDVNYKDNSDSIGRTPLIEAVNLGFDDIAIWLIEYAHANIEETDNMGNTPLMWAVFKRNNIMLMQLLDRGANVKHKNGMGLGAVDYAKGTLCSQSCGEVLDHYSPIARNGADLYHRVSLKEQKLYLKLWKHADASHEKLQESKAVMFFKRSSISDSDALQVWKVAAGSATFLDMYGFFVALRCIALIQRNEPVNIGMAMDVTKKLSPSFPSIGEMDKKGVLGEIFGILHR